MYVLFKYQKKRCSLFFFIVISTTRTVLYKIILLHFQNTKQPTEKPISSDPHNFRNLNIFPSKDDLLDISNVKIVPHIVNGAYPSLEHYLDLQFKLLREDCFGPLREGISW